MEKERTGVRGYGTGAAQRYQHNMIPVLVFTEHLVSGFGLFAYLFVCLFGTEYSTGMRRRRLSQKKKKEEKRWRRKKKEKKEKVLYSRFYYRTVAVRYCTGTAQGKRKKERKKGRKRKEKERSNCIITTV